MTGILKMLGTKLLRFRPGRKKMGIKIEPHKIVNRCMNHKEWLIGCFKEDFILKYSVRGPAGHENIEELIHAGCYMRGMIDGNHEYFIIEKSSESTCYVPLSIISLFERHVEEITVTETTIVDMPVPDNENSGSFV